MIHGRNRNNLAAGKSNMGELGIPIEPFTPYIQTFGASIGIFFGILAFKIILAKRFNGFRIVLLRTIDPKALKIDA